MPILSRKARAGAKPFVFFKGTEEEIRGTSLKEINRIFKSLPQKSPLALVGWVLLDAINLKTAVLSAVKKLKRKKKPEIIFPVFTRFGRIRLRVSLRKGKILVHQYPATHGVRARGFFSLKISPSFENLLSILSAGFVSKGIFANIRTGPNVSIEGFD